MHIYAVIIGTEILNARRQDKHFTFLRDRLLQNGYELYASFIVKDDIDLITGVYELVKNDPDSILFSFGGIGSTPDDLTRDIAAKVFTGSPTQRHEKFFQDILNQFGKEAYPHRVHMADLPKGARLLKNPVNNMSGFYLEDRFFFMPGFPQMAHPMVDEIITNVLPQSTQKYRFTLYAQTSENTLIDLMQQTPSHIELSSLPIFRGDKREVELSLAGSNRSELQEEFDKYINFLDQAKISYKILKSK